MPVALLPPVSTSGGPWSGQHPLTEGPRYVRGRGSSRWHRPRNATTWPDGRTIYSYWCGPSGTDGGKYGPLWLTDETPSEEPVCGTCVGRALGAGQDDTPAGLPPLRFDPRWIKPSAVCPGSRSRSLFADLAGHRCGRCLACGDIHPVRAFNGWNSYGAGLVRHAPGAGLVEPCPFHAWSRLEPSGDTARCGCGYPGVASVGATS
jgi:hypothetical protein